MKRFLFFAAIVFLLFPQTLISEPLAVKEFGYTIDLPEGWISRDSPSPGKLSFEDARSGGLLQVSIYGHERSLSAEQMENALRGRLNAAGDGASFSFSGRDAYLSDIEFQSSGRLYEGYVLIAKDLGAGSRSIPEVDAVLIAFAPTDLFKSAEAGLLSALDSFSPDADGLLLPGAISQFVSPFPDPEPQKVSIPFMGRIVSASVGKGEEDVGQVVIEREAGILSTYASGEISAWKRFYRIIYRDGYHRVDSILEGIRSVMSAQAVPKEDIPLDLLSWVQGFDYERTGTLSDFLSPLSVALSDSGDCDSRAILYDILLDHLGFRTILFVSERYEHALAGVALDRPGASLEVDGTRYLVAETTDKVDIGLIAADMADPSAWIPMSLRN